MFRASLVLLAAAIVSPALAQNVDKSAFLILNPTPAELRRPFNTDRPGKTDSPFTIDAGVFQIEADVFSWTVDRDNPKDVDLRVRTILAGQTNLKVGLTNWMDVQLIAQTFIDRRTSGSDFGQPLTQQGFGDSTVRLKINLLGNDGGTVVAAIVGSLKLPTNGDALGNSVYEPGFALPVSVTLPAGFTLFAQIRADIVDAAGRSSPRVVWSNPIGVSRAIVGKLSGYVEFFNAVSSDDRYPWIGTLDGGVIYQLTPNCSVDANVFYGVTDRADDLTVFTGFAVRF